MRDVGREASAARAGSECTLAEEGFLFGKLASSRPSGSAESEGRRSNDVSEALEAPPSSNAATPALPVLVSRVLRFGAGRGFGLGLSAANRALRVSPVRGIRLTTPGVMKPSSAWGNRPMSDPGSRRESGNSASIPRGGRIQIRRKRFAPGSLRAQDARVPGRSRSMNRGHSGRNCSVHV